MWLPPALLLLGLPGCLAIQGPASVRGWEQGSVTVQCHYDPRWKAYNKWWCRGRSWRTCQILIQTRGSEEEEKNERVSIKDDQSNHSFKVTMERLGREDAGMYWCGIQRFGTDLGARVKVIIGPEGASTMASKMLAGPTAQSNSTVSSELYKRNYYMLLVFVKVPILLVLAGAILWMKWGSDTLGPVGTALCRNWNSEPKTWLLRGTEPSHLDLTSSGSLGETPPKSSGGRDGAGQASSQLYTEPGLSSGPA
ncbi:CMRF35-like molecule 7 [Dipodomys spectabilis]|uniref:CMRF35-like molecule 7 n=1 Tax=Dipodomys spectabilis TaxID=105255 RepID=UPI001C536EF4|nr:CMRF35-like molecule 7 [Dipodomys spectabilis]